MSLAAVEELIESEKALISALDADDAGAIERRTQAFRNAIERVAPLMKASDATLLAPRAREALELAEAARVRVAFLADATRRRIATLADATGQSRGPALYGSQGRLRA